MAKKKLTKRALFPEFFRNLLTIRAEVKKERTRAQVVARLGPMADVGYMFVSSYDNRIDLKPSDRQKTRALALTVARRMKEIANGDPKGALGVTSLRAAKEFCKSTGKIKYTIPGPIPGWRIVVEGGDPKCKVRPVVRNVHHDTHVTPAYDETVTEYVIDNPEECGAA